MEIFQFVFNLAVVACVVATTIYMRNQVKINSNTIAMISILNQRVGKLEIAEKPRKKG